jgi:hypothetical protein
MKNVKLTQMSSNRTGEAVKNQFTIETPEGEYFQSYDSVIAFRPKTGKIQLDSYYWDYSKTTGKYRNQFLNESKQDTQLKIDKGIYILTDLNTD